MTRPSKASNTNVKRTPRPRNADSAEALFERYPAAVKSKLLALRRLILGTAKATRGVGALQETLKWGSQAT